MSLRRWLRGLIAPLLAPIARELTLQRTELRFLRSTLTQGFEIMSQEQNDLAAAVDALTAEVTVAIGQIKTAAGEIADLTAQLAGASPSGAETLVAKINAQTALLKAAADALVPPVIPQPAPVAQPDPPPAPVQIAPVAQAAPAADPAPQPVAQPVELAVAQQAPAAPQA